MLPRLASLALLVMLPGSCADPPRGDLEVHWSLNGDRDPAACQAAGVAAVRVLVDHTGAPPDSDPTDPEWPFVDLPCDAGQGTLRLGEGIYRVRLVALDGAGDARSGFTDLVGVEVVEGGITRVPDNPEVEPPVDLTVPVCGDGVAQPGEWCDATDLGGYDCANRGFDGGFLGCTATCTLDEAGCTACGDGVLAPGEACDASDLGGLDCAGLGWDSGTLACAADCALDETGCVGCGNAIVEGGEECDDGNRDDGDGCSSDCRIEPTQGRLRILWTPQRLDGTPATCADLAVDLVAVTAFAVNSATPLAEAEVPCDDQHAFLEDVPFGLVTVQLVGWADGHAAMNGEGSSSVFDHHGSPTLIDVILWQSVNP